MLLIDNNKEKSLVEIVEESYSYVENTHLEIQIVKGADFTDVYFNDCFITDSLFEDCIFEGSTFSNCVLSGSTFNNCNMKNVTIVSCNLLGVDFEYCSLVNATISECLHIDKTEICKCDITDCDITNSYDFNKPTIVESTNVPMTNHAQNLVKTCTALVLSATNKHNKNNDVVKSYLPSYSASLLCSPLFKEVLNDEKFVCSTHQKDTSISQSSSKQHSGDGIGLV